MTRRNDQLARIRQKNFLTIKRVLQREKLLALTSGDDKSLLVASIVSVEEDYWASLLFLMHAT